MADVTISSGLKGKDSRRYIKKIPEFVCWFGYIYFHWKSLGRLKEFVNELCIKYSSEINRRSNSLCISDSVYWVYRAAQYVVINSATICSVVVDYALVNRSVFARCVPKPRLLLGDSSVDLFLFCIFHWFYCVFLCRMHTENPVKLVYYMIVRQVGRSGWNRKTIEGAKLGIPSQKIIPQLGAF